MEIAGGMIAEVASTSSNTIAFQKRHCVALLAVPVLYASYVCLTVLFHAPSLQRTLADMGIDEKLPWPASLFFATYKFWWLVPVALAFAIIDFARRPEPTARHAAFLLVAFWITGAAMQALANEGSIAPLVKLMKDLS